MKLRRILGHALSIGVEFAAPPCPVCGDPTPGSGIRIVLHHHEPARDYPAGAWQRCPKCGSPLDTEGRSVGTRIAVIIDRGLGEATDGTASA